jgi:hypothetical protein
MAQQSRFLEFTRGRPSLHAVSFMRQEVLRVKDKTAPAFARRNL